MLAAGIVEDGAAVVVCAGVTVGTDAGDTGGTVNWAVGVAAGFADCGSDPCANAGFFADFSGSTILVLLCGLGRLTMRFFAAATAASLRFCSSGNC